MPEGHTIHRLARDLRKDLTGRTVPASSPQGRFADSADVLDGGVVSKVEAAGKHLFVHWQGGEILHVHLGLIGKFRPYPVDLPLSGEIRLRLEGDETAWHLTGPQTCALVEPAIVAGVLDALGPDPLRRDGRRTDFVERIARSKKAIGAILLDQDVIAGIGNVFRSEFLFMLGIHPSTPASSLSEHQANEIWDIAADLLRVGVKLNRIVTVTPEDAGAARGRLSDVDRLYAYKREGLPCRRCGTEIVIGQVANRSMWWCPRCQPA